jgi:urease accessory protein
MRTDTRKQRKDLPYAFTSLTSTDGVQPVADWVTGCLTAWHTTGSTR